jgi:branched-chain amino acid transport system substrate-binding protein
MVRRLLAAVAVALLAATGCPPAGSSGGAADTYRLAFAGPLTGSAAPLGNSSKKGAELAVKQRNDAGGINGKKVELIIADDKGDANEANNVAEKLVSDPLVSIVIGHFNSACSNAAKVVYNRDPGGVVQFSPGSTAITVCKGSPWTFRNLYHDGYQGVFLARYVKEILGHTKLALAFDNDDYGRGLKDAIVAKAGELGITIVAEESYIRERTSDFKQIATNLQAKGPQSIVVCGLQNEAALLAKAIRGDLGWKEVQLLGADGVMEAKYVETAGAAAEGTLITTPYFFSAGASPEAKKFGEAYQALHQEAPGTWAALAYDAANMAMKALEAVGPERAKVKDWFATRKDGATGFAGVTGVTFFDEHGDCPSKPASVVVVKNGAFELAEKQLPAQ